MNQNRACPQQFRLAPYAPAIAAIGKADKTYAVQWLYRREASADGSGINGKLTLPGLQAGRYRATWWDTSSGKSISDETVEATKAGTLSLTTPPVTRDVAVFVERVTPGKAKQQAARGKRGESRGGRAAAKYPPPSAGAPVPGPGSGQ